MQLDDSSESDKKHQTKLSVGEFSDRKPVIHVELAESHDAASDNRHLESQLIRTLKNQEPEVSSAPKFDQERVSDSEGESSLNLEFLQEQDRPSSPSQSGPSSGVINRAIKTLSGWLTTIREFYDSSKWDQKETYLKLVQHAHEHNLTLGMAGMCTQFAIWELLAWFDTAYQPKLTWIRITYTFSILLLLSELSFRFTANKRVHSRSVLIFLIILRVSVRIIEMTLLDFEHMTYLAKSALLNLMLEFILITTFVASSGQFFLVESILLNSAMLIILGCMVGIYWPTQHTPLSGLLIVMTYLPWSCFNAMDSKKLSDDNFRVYKNLAELDHKSSQLSNFLSRLLPKHTTQALLRSRQTSEVLNSVTLLYADIVGFTEYSAGRSPRQVIELLSKLFTEFDKECNRLGLYKLYTIGDCYVVSSILDRRNRKTPMEEASDVVNLGLNMIETVAKVRKLVGFDKLDMRIGVHTGQAYGGVIGTEIVRYDLYGKDVVIANKMESGGQPGRVCVSDHTRALLLESSNYVFVEHELIYIKTLGTSLKSFFVKRAGLA